MLKNSLKAHVDGRACEDNIYIRKNTRFTVITDRLIRVEHSKNGEFFDEATQTVWFRNLGKVDFSVKETRSGCLIKTDKAVFLYNDMKKRVESVTFVPSYKTVPVSNKNNLGGTVRTLDMTAGIVKLSDGLMSRDGVSFFDDSDSFAVLENGELKKRDTKESDVYVFAYGNDYSSALCDFYKISGKTPLVPRFALGNWWSRYYAYTQDGYENLMSRFESENIPFTVATVDMDWHWVDVDDMIPDEKKSTLNPFQSLGWTGYSWNTDLFPDYKGFLKFLHNKGLHVTLNLHPRDGIRSHESMYKEMALANGIDPRTKEGVKFRIGDANFWNTYFDIIHKPYERDGVDFWWIDWQQGTKLDVKGLDPLFALNHYHFLDNAEDGRMPLILSRYAGLGSHRYPLGFSGDSVICWNSLKLQPYFTSTASNVGYTWWSHDIGGHTLGYRDDDLYIRWLQFGVFSPIMRLHSSSDDLLGKEPWMYKSEARNIAVKFLRLRHRMIPYLYTADMKTHETGEPLCRPMYYDYPDENEAYECKNEYMFSSALLCAPITEKQNKKFNMGKAEVWLPAGRWTDIFTGRIYHGNQKVTMFRDIDSFPVLAKEGAVIPLSADKGNSCSNPENLEILIYRGNGKYALYEDDGKTDFEKRHALTPFKVTDDSSRITFTASSPTGDVSVVPERRNYILSFKDVKSADLFTVLRNGEKTDDFEYSSDCGHFTVYINGVTVFEKIEVVIDKYIPLENSPLSERIINVFSRIQAHTLIKDAIYAPFKNVKSACDVRKIIKRSALSSDVKEALYECTAE